MRCNRLAMAMVVWLAAWPAVAQSPADATVVRLAMNPALSNNLPVYFAIDKGYFAEEGLKIEVAPLTGSTSAAIPLLARGDIDILPGAASPAFFNQKSQGFDLEIVAAAIQYAPGWTPDNALLVRKDLYDSGAIKSPADLKGHSLDIGPVGSPINFYGRQLEQRYELSGSATITAKYKAAGDWLAALQNKAVDALVAVEPAASAIVKDGFAIKIGSLQDIYPDWSMQYIITSRAYAKAKEETLVKFLKALLRAANEIDKAGPTWTPDALAAEVHASGLSADQVKAAPPPHPATTGDVSVAPLQTLSDYYAEAGLLTAKVDPASLLDLTYVRKAQAALGVK